MTNVFTRTTKHQGTGGNHARVTGFDGCLLICAIAPLAKKAATIAMTPEQARALAQGIIEAADRAEGKQ